MNNNNSNSKTNQIRTPPVLWAQRVDQLLLTIDIEDCKAPKVDLQKDKLHFKGQSDSIQNVDEHMTSEVTVEFYKPINVEESKHSVKARGIEFVIKKEETGWWPRLLKGTTKQHWLKIDFPKWKDEDDTDDEAAAGMGGMGGMGGFGGGAGGAPDFGDFMQQFGNMGGGGGMPGMGDDDDFAGDDDEEDDDDTEQPMPDLEEPSDTK